MPTTRVSSTALRAAGGAADLRQGNLTSILRYVRDNGSSSRHDIAVGCGLGISTMTDLISELRSRGLVRELEPVRRPAAGRPTRPIALDGEPWCTLGIHIESDVLRFAVSTVGGREVWTTTVPAELGQSHAEADQFIRRTMLDQLGRLPADSELLAVEVGLPGHVSRERGVVTSSQALGWQGYALQSALRDALGEFGLDAVPVGLANDCHLAALHATRIELGLSAASVTVYLGGVRALGSGVIINGEIFRGSRGAAGDLGHHHHDPHGRSCWCGRRGCLETVVGLRHLLDIGGLMDLQEASELVRSDPGAAVTQVLSAAEEGNGRVLEALADAGRALGRVFDDLVGVLNPDAAILGGYLTPLSAYLMPEIEAVVSLRSANDPFSETQLIALRPDESRVVRGAALAARDACLDSPLQLTRVLA